MTDREAFEAWHLVQFPKCPAMAQMKNPDGDYVYIATEWAAWQAATATERERCAKVCEDYAEGSSYRIRPKLAEAIRKG